jgi:N-terminal domain of anti-restriction factor ArdC
MKPHPKPAVDVPKWASLLIEAVNKPGLIMEAYSAFHRYSIGNQILALVQCKMRGLEPGPINTFPGWQALGRSVKRGERALTLCMPITRKVRDEDSPDNETENCERSFTSFMYKPRWFVLAQTDGDEIIPPCLPAWNAGQALAALNIEQITFKHTDGNCQGYAKQRQIAINPVAQLPHKTLFHEVAHVVLGHTAESDSGDTEQTPKNLCEVEAEAVALVCCEALNLEGARYCRGYIQGWLYPVVGYNGGGIPEKSAQKIFHAADQILQAGRLTAPENANEKQVNELDQASAFALA